MEIVILVIHVILALSIIGVILLQPPENSSLGGLGGSNQLSAFSGRSQGNILTRTTAILATLFIITSLTLAILAGHKPAPTSVLDAVGSDASAPAMNNKTDEKAAAKTEDKTEDQAPDQTSDQAPSVPLAK